MQDSHGRTIDYIRISVTDQCNLRCVYCMPCENTGLSACQLTIAELETLLRLFCGTWYTEYQDYRRGAADAQGCGGDHFPY